MELSSLQIAVARLSTDAALRARFAADPMATAEGLGLRGEDAALLARMNTIGLDRFTSTLFRKELKRIRSALPELCRALGEQLQPLLAEFRATPHESQRQGACAFAKFVARRPDINVLTRDVARLEGVLHTVRDSWMPIGFCRVQHRMDDVGKPFELIASGRRRRIAFIFRMAGRIRIWYCPAAWRSAAPTTCVVGSDIAR